MRYRRAVTPVEVLVIVVILGAVLCGVVAWIQQAREATRRQTCESNLHDLAAAVRGYSKTLGAFPCATVVNEELPPEKRLSWYVEVWAFMDLQEGLLIDRKKPWDAEENLPLRRIYQGDDGGRLESELRVVPQFLCPSASPDLRDIKPGPTSFVGIAGIGADAASLPAGDRRVGVFGYDRQTRPSDITDEPRNTALLAETTLDNGPWTAGGRSTVRGVVPEDTPCLGVGRQFGGNHPGGGNVAFVDGSGRFLSEAIDPFIFAAMATIAGDPGEDDTHPSR